jgi:NADPH2 dehydrogenase
MRFLCDRLQKEGEIIMRYTAPKQLKTPGESGAKLIWGGEAAAVRSEGKGNPRQLVISSSTQRDIAALRSVLVEAHKERFGTADDLITGLQLTHSGRFSRPSPDGRPKPLIAYHHPYLDTLAGVFVRAAVLAGEAGFDFVDIKHCHGYLGHELLSARTRKGSYGGSMENRSRFLREIIKGIRRDAPGLEVGVRISFYDFPPYRAKPDSGEGYCLHGPGNGTYKYAFGGPPSGRHAADQDSGRAETSFSRHADYRLGILVPGAVDTECGAGGCPGRRRRFYRPRKNDVCIP